MKQYLLALVLALAHSLVGQEPTNADTKEFDSVIRQTNNMTIDLYTAMNERKGNMVVSPYGIVESLALPYNGAEGATESQMARVLKFRATRPIINEAFSWLNERLVDNSPYFLLCGLWIQKGDLNPAFKDVIEKGYQSVLRQVDFITRPDGARIDMNNWFRDKTQGKIMHIVPQNELNSLTRMVSLSAAYVKGKWEQPFDVRATKQAAFFSDRYVTTTVPTMFAEGDYNFLEEREYSILELPYSRSRPGGAGLSLFIVLPHETYGLKAIEKELVADKIFEWRGRMQKRRVTVGLPKFQLTDSHSLVNVLSRLGMTEPLSDGADFTRIREIGDLKISNIYQKVYYTIDEGGSEAGIAFGSTVVDADETTKIATFSANHPFLFLLVDRDTGTILLIGRITAP